MYFRIVSVEAFPVEQTTYPSDQNVRSFQDCLFNSRECFFHILNVDICCNRKSRCALYKNRNRINIRLPSINCKLFFLAGVKKDLFHVCIQRIIKQLLCVFNRKYNVQFFVFAV